LLCSNSTLFFNLKLVTPFNFDVVQAITTGYSPFGKAALSVNVYYVDGLLIDVGQSRMRKAILNFVKDLSVKQICVTHHHEDHTGNLVQIKSQFDVPVYGSAKCEQLMKNPPPISLPQKIYWGNRPAFNITALEKNELSTPNYTFKIIDIPGHAEDMIALYEASKGWLFSGDLYINSSIKYMLANESIAQQIKSIKKILQLDFDTLFCGHNFKAKNGKQKLKDKLQFLEWFYGQVCYWYYKQCSPKIILKKMKLNENRMMKVLSRGKLSQLNMIKSVIKDEQKKLKQS